MKPTQPLKIIQLTAQNIKKLSAVQITPKGDPVVIISGKNGAGKSCVLDSIEYAMAGKDALPDKPVRKGQAKGKVRLDLGDYVVTRTFTAAGGTSLSVTGKEGAKFPSPQALLDSMASRHAFDPLAFSRQNPYDQCETLRKLVGLDFTDLDAQHQALYEKRHSVNATLKQLEARLTALGHPPDPEECPVPVSMEALNKEFTEAFEANRLRGVEVQRLKEQNARFEQLGRDIDNWTRELERIQKIIAGYEAERTLYKTEIAKQEKLLAGMAATNLAEIQERMNKAEAENKAAARVTQYRELEEALRQTALESDGLTQAMADNRASRTAAIQKAKFPVDGLALGEDGVTFNGLPFSQASSAEQLRVSVAMGLAMNPRLKVLLIRDGSLLDEESLELVAKMAAEASAQVWIERVEEGGTVSVVIEDGHIKGEKPPEPETELPLRATKPAESETEAPPDEPGPDEEPPTEETPDVPMP